MNAIPARSRCQRPAPRRVRLLRTPIALAIAAALLAPVAFAAIPTTALPAGDATSIKSGIATISSPTATSMVINQTSKGAIIDWTSFNIGSAASVNFQQPTGGVTLNRDLSGHLSEIDGTLTANGSVFIVNAAGVTFGDGAQVNVGGIVASTMAITNDAFNAGVAGTAAYVFTGPMTSYSAITNSGHITVPDFGTAALLGSQIQNAGTITAPQGTIALAAGTQVTLDIGGDGLTQLVVTPGTYAPALSNNGAAALVADGGQVLMDAGGLSGGYGGTVTNYGLIQARSLQSRDGVVTLTAISSGGGDASDSVQNSGGSIDVSGTAAGVGGGSITLTSGATTAVTKNDFASTLDASGATSGGSINLYGTTVGVDGGSTLDVSGTSKQGGSINVNATGDASVQESSLKATGATAGGNIEFTASNGVAIAGAALDVSSTQGAGGGVSANGTNVTVADATPPACIAVTCAVTPSTINANGTTAGGSISLVASNQTVVFGDSSMSADASDGVGGSISITGNNVAALDRQSACGTPPCPHISGVVLSASGSAGGGTIQFIAQNVAEFDTLAQFSASATGGGNGGTITVTGAGGGLYAFGTLSARGGTSGGDGGNVETSGAAVDLRGISVDTRSPMGTAGTWLVDPFDVQIFNGAANGSLPATLFTPIANSVIQDGDINRALNNGSSVTINTGAAGAGSPTAGNIIFEPGVVIDRTDTVNSAAPLTLQFDANANIFNSGATSMVSSGGAGPLNINFDSNANGTNAANGYIYLDGVTLQTNGGAIQMYGEGNATTGYATGNTISGITLTDTTIDTRVGGSDANAGGDVSLRGAGVSNATCAGYTGPSCGFAVTLFGSGIYASTGAVSIIGQGDGTAFGVTSGSGVFLGGNVNNIPSVIATTSGAINVVGTTAVIAPASPSYGTYLDIATVQNGSGTIDLRGYATTDGTDPSTGLPQPNSGLEISGSKNGVASVYSTSGDILLSGSSDGSGLGVGVRPEASVTASAGNVYVLARNNGSTDALALNGVITGAIVNLRPGFVDATGAITESPYDPISLGGTTGFALSNAELANIDAGTTIFGSGGQTGALTVDSAITYAHNLTLDAGQASIAIGAALNVGANTLGLLSDGAITQTAPITAGALVAQSTSDAVTLDQPNVVSVFSGSAFSDLTFVNSAAVDVGAVVTTGFPAIPNPPVVTVAAPITFALGAPPAPVIQAPGPIVGNGVNSGGDVLLQALTGDMVLNDNVSGTNIDLVSAGVFTNASSYAINASGTWRVWSNTWVGETRGGLAGSGTLPNVYGCSYGASCAIVAPAADNHFMYALQPTLDVTIDSASREYGLANPALTYTATGLINGDVQANALGGAPTTAATNASDIGSYGITSGFTSSAGYLLNVTPAALVITPATLTYVADPYSRIYGDANGVLAGTVTGFRLTDTLATATAGTLAWNTGAAQGSNVGNYAITGSGLAARNYVFVQDPANALAFAITPATLTYVADPYTREYGDANGVLGGTVSGFKLTDTLASATTGTLAWTSAAAQGSNVGNYDVTGSGLAATNYVFVQDATNAAAFAITPATLLYAANPYTREYGDANGALSGTVSGFKLTDTLATATTGTLAWNTTATQGSNIGNYGITGSGLAAINYLFVQDKSNVAALAITPATLTYAADPYTREYGDANGALGGTVSGFKLTDTQATATTGTLAWNTGAAPSSNVGNYDVTGSGLAATNYVFVQDATNAAAFAITPATLTYVADPYTREYGDANGALGGTVSGFKLTDTQATATTGTLAWNTSAAPSSNVGNYGITGSGLAATNYVFVQDATNAAAFAITPATLLYAANPYTREYGDANGALGGTVSGFKLTDTLASATTGTLAWNTPATQGSNVGNYDVTGSGLAATNYVFVQDKSNVAALAITPATITYVADPYTREYGDANGVLGGTMTGFKLTDTQATATTGTLAWTSAAAQGSNIGDYGITGSGLAATNYVFVQDAANAAAFVITPATLLYVANPYTREYGDANGALGGTVSGFKLSDTLATATTGTLAWNTPAAQGSNIGDYGITGSGLAATNYVFVQDKSNVAALAITPATLTYVANPYTREYGDANGALGGTVSGFKLSDTQATVTTGTLAWNTPATQGSNVGNYDITGSGLAATNYVFVQDKSNVAALAITPATLTYVADPYTREYGDANGALGGTVSGFKLSDTQATATTGTLAWNTPAAQGSNVGDYDITGSGLAATNYVFVQGAANATAFAITPATLTYVADPIERMYHSSNGTVTGSVVGFKLSDTQATATTGTLVWSTTADINSQPGSYVIEGSGLQASNYIFAQDPANGTALAVTLPPLAYEGYATDQVRDLPTSYVYDLNIEAMSMCPATDLLASARDQKGDNLTRQWARVRSRPNLANCVTVKLQSGCSSF